MKITRLTKTAMPARLGEIDGIVHPMPIQLSEESKKEYPIFEKEKIKRLIASDNFLKFIFSELGQDENAMIQIYSTFVLEDNEYCRKYKEG